MKIKVEEWPQDDDESVYYVVVDVWQGRVEFGPYGEEQAVTAMDALTDCIDAEAYVFFEKDKINKRRIK